MEHRVRHRLERREGIKIHGSPRAQLAFDQRAVSVDELWKRSHQLEVLDLGLRVRGPVLRRIVLNEQGHSLDDLRRSFVPATFLLAVLRSVEDGWQVGESVALPA